jgi:hypothetical protein
MKRNHYVYRIDDPITKEFYIGSRTSDVKPEEDNYMGSYKTWKPQDPNRLVKTIIKGGFRKRETALAYESKLITENINHQLNRNYHSVDGFSTEGISKTEEQKDSITKSVNSYFKKMTSEEKRRIYGSERSRHYGEDNGFYGKTHSKETISKILSNDNYKKSRGKGLTFEERFGVERALEMKQKIKDKIKLRKRNKKGVFI